MLGVTQRHAMRKARARASLEASLALSERLGARLWSEKAQAEIASIGGRTPVGDVLTSTEQRVQGTVALTCLVY